MDKESQFQIEYTFVGIMGLSTSVITETLYGIWEMAGGKRTPEGLIFPTVPHAFPKKIVILTTNRGKDKEQELKQKICQLFNIYHPQKRSWSIEDPFFKNADTFSVVTLGAKETSPFEKEFAENFKELAFSEIKAIKDYSNAGLDRKIIAGMTGGFVPMYSALRSALEFLGGPQDIAFNIYLECEGDSFTGQDVENCATFFAPLPKHLSEEETLGISKYQNRQTKKEIIKEIDLRQTSVSISIDDIIPHGSFLANTYDLESKDTRWITSAIKLCAWNGPLHLILISEEGPVNFSATLQHPADNKIKIKIPLDFNYYVLLRSIARSSILKRINKDHLWPGTLSNANDSATSLRWQFTRLFETLVISSISQEEKAEIISSISNFNNNPLYIATRESLSDTRFEDLIEKHDRKTSEEFIKESKDIIDKNRGQKVREGVYAKNSLNNFEGPASKSFMSKIEYLWKDKKKKKHKIPQQLVQLLLSYRVKDNEHHLLHYPDDKITCEVIDHSPSGKPIDFENYLINYDEGKLLPEGEDPYAWLWHYHELHPEEA